MQKRPKRKAGVVPENAEDAAAWWDSPRSMFGQGVRGVGVLPKIAHGFSSEAADRLDREAPLKRAGGKGLGVPDHRLKTVATNGCRLKPGMGSALSVCFLAKNCVAQVVCLIVRGRRWQRWHGGQRQARGAEEPSGVWIAFHGGILY